MESDTDSDSSHISATPPRQYAPPPLHPTLLSSSQNKSRVRVSSLPSNRRLFTSKRKKPHPKAHSQPSRQPDFCSDPPFSSAADPPSFSVRICRPSAPNPSASASNSIDQLPAGFFSKSASFSSRYKNRNLSFDPIDVQKDGDFDHADSPPGEVPPASDSQPNSVGDVSHSFRQWPSDTIDAENDPDHRCPAASPSQPEVAASEKAFRVKVAKEHPNSIGANVSILPWKRPKYGKEGNFVRLNINGYGHKFGRKGARRKHPLSSSSRGRKSWRRSKHIPKSGNEAEAIICDEDGLVSELSQRNGCSEFSHDLINQAVMATREEPSDGNLRNLLKLTHGYDSFREGQLEAIRRVVAGQSTLLVLPTGAGKSLCYQLPALILPGVTLVISPLVALMVDQLRKLPPMLRGGLLCSNQTSEEASETLQRVRNGNIKVLFVSPERFLNSEFLSTLGDISLISLVVVDEAHCISEWSHNFRPSYMRLRSSLVRSNLNVQCFLAMTATATAKTLQAIVCALEIPSTNIIQTSQVRGNLRLNVTLSGNRMKDLLVLMQTSLVEVRSVIIYCKFQSETDLVSKYLRDNNISAKSYHSGIPAKERSRIQELFCSNKIRVVVATVAFGMGLDKSDVGAVIHFSLPESLEEYVQETGRAGRDGRLSHCYLLLDDLTYFRLRSLLHSDGIDECTMNKFLVEVFNKDLKLPRNVCSLVKESMSQKFDMKEEVMHTVLTHLELGQVTYLQMLPQLNVTCYLHFHKVLGTLGNNVILMMLLPVTQRQLDIPLPRQKLIQTPPALLSSKNIVVAMVLKKSETKQGHYVFDIPTVANNIGIATTELLNQLQHLKSMGEITYEMKDPAFCYVIKKNPVDFCSLATHITKWLREAETCKVWKLDAMYNAAVFAAKICNKVDGCLDSLHTSCLQRKISDYFSRGDDVNCGDFLNKLGINSPFLRADIKVFLQSNSHAKFTPRAIARIMHGIASPAFPSTTWSKSHFWGRYSQVDFRVVMEAATSELMNFVGKVTI